MLGASAARRSCLTEGLKVAAILVADMVDYSRLNGADKELTLTRLRTLRSNLIRTRKPKPSLPRM